MSTSSEKVGDVLIVAVTGVVDSSTAAALESDLLTAIDESGSTRCVLDLTGLSYISSAGLRVVLIAAKHLKSRCGELAICGMQARVHEVFEVTGFLGILAALPTRADALEHLNK